MANESTFPPVFLSTGEIRLRVSRAAKRGRVRRIGPRLYTTAVSDDPVAVIRRNLWEVVGLVFPDTVVGYRTALEGKPSPEGTVNVVGGYDRMLELPGLTVRQIKGPGPLKGDTRFMGRLWLASRARAFLESLRPSRATAAGARSLPREEIERRIERIVRISGEEDVNALRDQARAIVPELDAAAEFHALNAIIGAVLGSQAGPLTAPAAVARAAGEPYDADRLDRFQALHAALLAWVETPRSPSSVSAAAFRNAAFVDAYFSNYIEGTEFGVDEAIEIVFEGRIPERRPADAHDVLGTYRIVSSRDEMAMSLADARRDFDDFIRVLRRRHEVIMAARPEKKPGEFKVQANFAGNTAFVDPDLVVGTLRRGFELFRSLQGPFARAAFMMFLVAEVHPFADGNGRIARIMTNAELIAEGRERIIIPTVYREDYVLALRALTRQGRTDGLLRMLDRAQEFISRIDFHDLVDALEVLREANAFADPSEARLILPTPRKPA
ncbi:MAG TPA: Fic family protein [Longimicrobiales bacterium]|nr:Fic family protein [Longimicrobiales bacterium]